MRIYVEFRDIKSISRLLGYLRDHQISISDLETNRVKGQKDSAVSILGVIQFPKKADHTAVIETLSQLEGVTFVEEMP